MPKKCDFCGIEYEEMTINVCQGKGCGNFCDSCVFPKDAIRGYCPKCGGRTQTLEEIGEPDNIDEKIDDAKGYE